MSALSVRLPESLHRKLAEVAEREGIRELERSMWVVTTASVRPLRTMGTASTRRTISLLQLVSLERSMERLFQALSTRGCRSERMPSPTKSPWNTVCVVEGRTWASAT